MTPLHAASTTDDMIVWLRQEAADAVSANLHASLTAIASRLEALYLGDEKTAIRELQQRVTDLEHFVQPVRS